jgi:hypothetical protein
MLPFTATPDRLATRQFVLTVVGGIAFAGPLTLVLALLNAAHGNYTSNMAWLWGVLQDWSNLVFPLLAIAILPALLTGWLRLGPMRRLLAYCQGLPPTAGRGLAVLGTFLLFELCVVPAALLGWALGKGNAGSLGGWYTVCAAFSLPWLLAALSSAWWVLRPPSTMVGLHDNSHLADKLGKIWYSFWK